MSKPKTIEGRRPVTREDRAKLLQESLSLEASRRAKIAKAIAHLREYGELSEEEPLQFGDALYFAVICTAIAKDGGSRTVTKAIKEAYGLADDDIGYILRQTGGVEQRGAPNPNQPELTFLNDDGTPQDLDALDALEKFDTPPQHNRTDQQIFGAAKALQLQSRKMSIPAGQRRAIQGYNVAPHKAKDQVIVSVAWELAKSLDYEFRLSFFDTCVENACYNLYVDGNETVTVAQIVREVDFMAGDQDASEERCKDVFDSLKRLGMLTVEVDFTEQMKMKGLAKGGTKCTIGGAAVPIRWGKIERNGIEKIAVRILAAPIFTAYSAATGNLMTIPRKIMMAATTRQYDENGEYIEGTGTLSNTRIVGDYRRYLAYQLNRIANTSNNKIKYNSIFEVVGDTLPMGKDSKGKVTRKKRKEVIAKLLNAFQAVGGIRSWKTTKDKKGVEDGVEITMPNPSKGLKAPGKRLQGLPEKH